MIIPEPNTFASMPICPFSLLPQTSNLPSAVRIQECCNPAAIPTILDCYGFQGNSICFNLLLPMPWIELLVMSIIEKSYPHTTSSTLPWTYLGTSDWPRLLEPNPWASLSYVIIMVCMPPPDIFLTLPWMLVGMFKWPMFPLPVPNDYPFQHMTAELPPQANTCFTKVNYDNIMFTAY